MLSFAPEDSGATAVQVFKITLWNLLAKAYILRRTVQRPLPPDNSGVTDAIHKIKCWRIRHNYYAMCKLPNFFEHKIPQQLRKLMLSSMFKFHNSKMLAAKLELLLHQTSEAEAMDAVSSIYHNECFHYAFWIYGDEVLRNSVFTMSHPF